MARLARFAWWTLGYNLLVVLWGAYVRASGSGAGCGSHWPLCNGEVVPADPTIATLIEYSHRLTSGVALLAVLALLVWTWKVCAPGHPARRAAALAMVFMVTEAAVGAGLVLFELVADNATMARAMFMAVHLVNTFFLLASLALSAWWLSGGAAVHLDGRRTTALWIAAGCLALSLVGSSGAVAALGDTLFPSGSLAEGLAADLSTTSHVLIRLRTLHPVLAVAAALGLLVGAGRLVPAGHLIGGRLHRALVWLVWGQLAIGGLNVVLLAPIWLQLVHLLAADAVWIVFVLLGAVALGHPVALTAPTSHPVRPAAASAP